MENPYTKEYVLCTQILTGIITSAAVLGNSLTLVAGLRDSNLHNKRYTFLFGLAISDLGCGLSLVVLTFATPMCLDSVLDITRGLPLWIFTLASYFHLMGMGIDKFIAIQYPLHYHSLVTRKSLSIALVIVWLTSVSLAVSFYAWISYNPRHCFNLDTVIPPSYQLGLSMGPQLLIAPVLIAIHIKIMKITRRHILRVASQTSNAHAPGGPIQHIAQQKGTKLVVVVLTCNLLAWVPYFIMMALRIGEFISTTSIRAEGIAAQIGFSMIGVNVVLYGFLNRSFRKAYKKVLCCG